MTPDLDIVTMQQCAQLGVQNHVVNGHHVTLLGPQGEPYCDCTGFKFSRRPVKTCVHVQTVRSTQCTWHQQHSDEPIVTEGVCPRCGGPTQYVRVAV